MCHCVVFCVTRQGRRVRRSVLERVVDSSVGRQRPRPDVLRPERHQEEQAARSAQLLPGLRPILLSQHTAHLQPPTPGRLRELVSRRETLNMTVLAFGIACIAYRTHRKG